MSRGGRKSAPTEPRSREPFARVWALGIEEECFVVDERGRHTSGTDELVDEHDPPGIRQGRLDHERFWCVLEIQMPLIASSADARDRETMRRQSITAEGRIRPCEPTSIHGYC